MKTPLGQKAKRKKKAFYKQIDAVIYELYGLGEDGAAIVEGEANLEGD